MAERLTVCVGCSRHVKAREARCPFCGTAAFAPSSGDPFRRMAFAAAVAAGMTSVACGGQSFTGSTGTGTGTGTATGTAMQTGGSTDGGGAGTGTGTANPTGTGTSNPTGTGTSTGASTDSGFPEDSPSVIAFYGIGIPLDGGIDFDATKPVLDAGEHEDAAKPGLDAGEPADAHEDAPSVVAFYGIASPLGTDTST